MFNLSGSELVFLVLIALVVLGPEKLPDAVRRFSKTYAEVKKMSTGFQSELKSALDEPMREMRETADAIKKAATFDLDAFDPTKPATSPEPTAPADSSATPTAETEPAADTIDEPEPEPRQPGPNFLSAAPSQLRTPLPVDPVVDTAPGVVAVTADEGTASE